jgi:hypothetical protein
VLNKALLPLIAVLASWPLNILRADDAPASEPTPVAKAKPGEFYFCFLECRYDLHKRVIERWEDLVKSNRDKLQPSKMTLHYHINPQGYISVIESRSSTGKTSQDSNEYKLAAYALALENKDPIPFPDLVSAEFPYGYFYQITLTIR